MVKKIINGTVVFVRYATGRSAVHFRQSPENVAVTENAGLTMMYWHTVLKPRYFCIYNAKVYADSPHYLHIINKFVCR